VEDDVLSVHEDPGHVDALEVRIRERTAHGVDGVEDP